MEIINKLGGYKGVQQILTENGMRIKYGTLAQQVLRKHPTSDVILKLWDYCEKNGINVKPEDFKGE